MTVYVIIALLCLLLVFVSEPRAYFATVNGRRVLYSIPYQTTRHKLQKHIGVILLAGMCFLTAFRSYNIGNDTKNYASMYTRIASGGLGMFSDLEIGYRYFCWFLSRLSDDPHFFFIVCAVFSYMLIGRYFLKYAYNFPVTVCLFFSLVFSFYLSGMRQSLAMVFVLYAYGFLKQRKKLLALILILTGSLLHTSALTALVFFLCDFIPRKTAVVWWLMISVASLSAMGALNLPLSVMLGRYGHFFDTANAGTGWLGVSVALLRNAVFFYFIFKACAHNWRIKENRLTYTNAFMLLFCTGLGYSMNLFTRMSEYFLLITCVDLPNALCYRRDQKTWNILICIVLVIYFFVILLFRPEWNHINPYEFWQ